MQNEEKLPLYCVILVAMLLLSSPPLGCLVEGKTKGISVSQNSEGAIIQTDYLTLKIVNNGPHFIWWLGNKSASDEIYEVNFFEIHEFSGDDEILDGLDELSGVVYIFKGMPWGLSILDDDSFVQITLTLSGLSNGAKIQFIVSIYVEDQTFANSEINGLSEVKIDIVVDNWHFSSNARGYAIHSIVSGTQEGKHRVQIRNGTSAEHGANHYSMQYESVSQRNKKVAYYKWATFAEVYNSSSYLETIDVGVFYSQAVARIPATPPITIPGVFLTYPNYGDGYKMVHDPSIGVYPDALNTIPLSIGAALGGLIFIVVVVAIIKKRK